MTTYPQIISEARRLPVRERLQLVEDVMRSVRTDLAVTPVAPAPSAPKLTRGMLKPEGALSGDEELREAYVDYLIEKYQ